MSVTVANTTLAPSHSVVSASSMVPLPRPVNDTTTQAKSTTRVYYQGPDGGIFRRTCVNGVCDGGLGPLWYAVPGTPLAAISWAAGVETRVYYLDHDYKLQEYCQTGDGVWIAGGLGHQNVQAAPNTDIAAVQFQSGTDFHLGVYFHEAGSGNIQEFIYASPADRWDRGVTVSSVLSGTGIASTSAEST